MLQNTTDSKAGAKTKSKGSPGKYLKPRVVLIIWNPWLMVVGSDSPVFTLYENNQAIFKQGRKGYKTVTLKQSEVSSVMAGTKKFRTLKHYYALSRATDQPKNTICITGGGSGHCVTIYGRLGKRSGVRRQAPPAFLALFDKLTSYQSDRSKSWFPEYVEVIIWPYEYSPEKPLDWPENWPDIKHRHTVKHGNSYSIYLPARNFQAFGELLSRRGQKQALRINGKKWAVSFRLPFPGEGHWMPR